MGSNSTTFSSSTMIKLTSSHGKTFELKQEFVKKANMLKQILTDLRHSEEEGNYPDEGIPLPSVAGEALEKIVEWLTLNEAEEPKTRCTASTATFIKRTLRFWTSAARAPSSPTLSMRPVYQYYLP
ncbi:hypothetical protein L596_023570 [Steinernema carpocapsae]|uniref:SKP1 component POZ domain-containing protein n=1 Tax=Steinernema carpocapsae TaxID=34508 RepID=A0A4U5ME44_STECR|nr:hypothetical protein L596_023570 [Steinernema carpocapsae]